MRKNWFRNAMLVLIAFLLIANLVVALAPSAYAAPTTQYRAIFAQGPFNDPSGAAVQAILDRHAGQGWQYVGTAGQCMIFKK
jgi:hypothetical protein